MKRIIYLLFFTIVLLAGQAFAACLAGDKTAPTRITDLVLVGATTSGAIVSFTAPTDASGVAAYDFRARTTPMNSLNFASSTVLNAPTPTAPGTLQTFTLSGLLPGVTYYFGMKSQDACGKWSTLSNVIMFTTLAAPVKRPVTLKWEHDDSKVAGFIILYGPASGAYAESFAVDKNSRTASVMLEPGTYYFAAKAFYNDPYVESGFSNEVSKTF